MAISNKKATNKNGWTYDVAETDDRVDLFKEGSAESSSPDNPSFETFSKPTDSGLGDGTSNGVTKYQNNLATYGLSDSTSYTQNPNDPTLESIKPTFSWSGTKPTYTSNYSSQIQSALDSILNRKDFSYDYKSDPLYEQYRDVYTRNGNIAARDAAGSSAALTGGYGNSYGTTAASQANQQYLGQLNSVVPQLEELAYQKYQNEISDNYNKLSALNTLENTDYNRYRDDVSDYYQDYSNAYNEYSGALSQYNYENEQKTAAEQYAENLAYQKERDAVTDQQSARELAYKYAASGLNYPYDDLTGLSGTLYSPVAASGSSSSSSSSSSKKKSSSGSGSGSSSKNTEKSSGNYLSVDYLMSQQAGVNPSKDSQAMILYKLDKQYELTNKEFQTLAAKYGITTQACRLKYAKGNGGR